MNTALHDRSDLICFPEMFITGYPPRDFLEREDFRERAQSALDELVRDSVHYPGLLIVVGTIMQNQRPHGNGLDNAAVVINNGQIVFRQSKSLLPTYDVFDEARYFDPSDSYDIYEWKTHKIGISICEDAWADPDGHINARYHIDPVYQLIDRGATLILNLSASPFHMGKDDIRYRLMRRHADKYKIPFVLVNQVGAHDELIFDGSSMVLNKTGKPSFFFPGFAEYTATVDLDNGMGQSFSAMDPIASVYEALCLGLGDYLRKCGFSDVVIGLSGGIDSTLVACIATHTLGPEHVIGVAMPSMYSSEHSVQDACTLAENLGINLKIIPIADIYHVTIRALQPHFTGTCEDITEENLQARIRGNILMALANKFHALTLATGNKSELSVGYCTMYGDMSGGLSVIGDVPKTMVYQLAKWINSEKPLIPDRILSKPPSAELKPGQTDQDTLPDYDILDAIIELYVDRMLGFQEIVSRGYDESVVKWVIQTIAKNEYKRRQAAPALKVTSKAFGMGRRIPVSAKHGFFSGTGEK